MKKSGIKKVTFKPLRKKRFTCNLCKENLSKKAAKAHREGCPYLPKMPRPQKQVQNHAPLPRRTDLPRQCMDYDGDILCCLSYHHVGKEGLFKCPCCHKKWYAYI
jgi:hypothetical protein